MAIVIAASVEAIAQANPTGLPDSPLPQSVKNAVLQQVSQHTGMPTSSFRLVSAEPRTWSDGCFGLADPGTFCTQALVPGWQVTVTDGRCRWVYRTNDTDRVRLE